MAQHYDGSGVLEGAKGLLYHKGCYKGGELITATLRHLSMLQLIEKVISIHIGKRERIPTHFEAYYFNIIFFNLQRRICLIIEGCTKRKLQCIFIVAWTIFIQSSSKSSKKFLVFKISIL